LLAHNLSFLAIVVFSGNTACLYTSWYAIRTNGQPFLRNQKAGSEKGLPFVLEVEDSQPTPELDAEQFLCLFVVHDKLVTTRNLCFEGVRQLVCNVFQFICPLRVYVLPSDAISMLLQLVIVTPEFVQITIGSPSLPALLALYCYP
jgi:hypothetical protein